MALMSSADMGGSNPVGSGKDPSNPSAGGRRPDNLQSAVYGTEYANPERWGPAAPPAWNAAENTASFEQDENYLAGARQPQIREANPGPMGLTADMAREDMSPTMRGETTLPAGGAYRDKVGDVTWEGQDFMPRAGGMPTQGMGSANGGRNFGTTQPVNIREGGVRAGGMIGLPAHINMNTADQRGPTA